MKFPADYPPHRVIDSKTSARFVLFIEWAMRRRRVTVVILQVSITIFISNRQFQSILVVSLIACFYFISISHRQHIRLAFRNSVHSTEEQRQPHLFDNFCRFAWTEPFDSTLKKRLKHPKRASCERYNIDLFKRYPATGEFSLKVRNYTGKLECVAQVLKGGFRPEAHTYQLGRTQTFIPKLNKRFWINADNFLLTCFTGQLVIFRKQFMGFKMIENFKLVVDGALPIPPPSSSHLSGQFSISILGIDSTSRAQFERHMRKTSDLLKKMGGVIFEAYNKVGDNSAVNLLPILADPLKETIGMNRFDDSGDVNLNKILPSKTPLDLEKIEWVWKQLPADFVTMFNDDVMHTSRGLFHYPPDNFDGGFGKSPTQFYFRPYYNHLYSQLSNWWRKCLDGELLAETFIDSWFRFERVFAKVPHFGFTFVSSLTHDDPNNLEMLDRTLYHRLDFLNRTGSLENTVLIILGDHGNRVHPINRYTFAGKIEERAPYLNIIVPQKFQKSHPEKYRILKENSQRFVSNFNLHATLKFLTFSSSNSSEIGKSLFEVQSSSKTCQDNNVISNHCLCMVDASQDLFKLPKSNVLRGSLEDYLTNSGFDKCFQFQTLTCDNVTETLMPNNYVQVWARTKISDSEVRRKKEKSSPIVYPYMNCHVESKAGDPVEILAQFRLIQLTQDVSVVYPPRIRAMSGHCTWFSFPKDYCSCLNAF